MFDRLFASRRCATCTRPDAYSTQARQNREMPGPTYSVEDRRRDFRAIFRETPAGRRVLAQTLARCRVQERSFVPGDSLETARREGMRDTGLWILETLAEDVSGRPATAEAEPAQPIDAG